MYIYGPDGKRYQGLAAVDPKATVKSALGISGIPHVVVLSTDGVVRWQGNPHPQADLNAAADVILAVAGMVEKDPSSIVELDINPLMVLAEGRGAMAADALIRLNADR
jgi:hypothetical protein